MYRSVIRDLDYTFKLDNNLGYKVLTVGVSVWLGMVVSAVLLSFGIVVL
jgi:hypothetical protein